MFCQILPKQGVKLIKSRSCGVPGKGEGEFGGGNAATVAVAVLQLQLCDDCCERLTLFLHIFPYFFIFFLQ